MYPLFSNNLNLIFMGNAILDFKDWLEQMEFETYDDVHSLYMSILKNDEYGGFKTSKKDVSKGVQYFIKCDWNEQPLILQSDKAKEYMLTYIEEKYCGDMGIDGWYAYHRAMEKDD